MMEQPADLSKLMDKLAGAKKIIAKEYGSSSDTRTSSNVNEEKNMPTIEERIKSKYPTTKATNTSKRKSDISPESIKNSNLPKEIMESLLDNPINVNADPLDGKIDELANKINEMAGIVEPIKKEPLRENIVTKSGLNENQIRAIVKDELMTFFGETMVKSVTEQVLSRFKRKKKA